MERKKYKTRVWRPFQREPYHWAWHDKKLTCVLQEFGRDLRPCHERIWRGYCDYDIFSIYDWFLGLMPTMLEDFRDHLHGYPEVPDSGPQKLALSEEDQSSEGMLVWKAVLDYMIFLLLEADEETCTRENPYEAEYSKEQSEFEKMYGPWGEKLMTAREKEDYRKGKGRRVYFPDNVEEYKPVSEKYFDERRKLEQYRRECKDEALALFSKWFYDLWD